ncbi:MAG TPA: cytochrome c oxidase accessory protein CcoG [Chthoniobacteraceae bacterium]|jgi:cytochrome c oxidase accessory protein FixG|nr:cytochrome c oxidase accessory protein CcoG [Chthoniobacteraceae bacterium]
MSAQTPSLERLATVNRDGSRNFVHAASVRGFYTRLRGIAGVAVLAVYAALPWIPVNGNPALFFDIAHRQFHIFGLTLVMQDFWLAFFLITGLGFSLFYITALLGRVWCGWACPQTIFLDIVRRIERLCEGDAVSRRRLDALPHTFGKFIRRGAKNILYGLFAFALAHVFISYFVSIPRLYGMVRESPLHNWSIFVFAFAMTAALWFDFSWFREQFCIVLCPYGRLQSVLLDNDSLVIGYDAARGEPRGRLNTSGAGDCVDCRRCVQVCPTGIDIRQGLQIECIACAACIDACDSVMAKIGRARGLVRYGSSNGFAGRKTRIIRPRMALYTVLLLIGMAVMTLSMSTVRNVNMTVLRMPGAPYYLGGGEVRNQYLLRITNKANHPQVFQVRILPVAGLASSGTEELMKLGPEDEQIRPLVAVMPQNLFRAPFPVRIVISSGDGKFTEEQSVPFLGPQTQITP